MDFQETKKETKSKRKQKQKIKTKPRSWGRTEESNRKTVQRWAGLVRADALGAAQVPQARSCQDAGAQGRVPANAWISIYLLDLSLDQKKKK